MRSSLLSLGVSQLSVKNLQPLFIRSCESTEGKIFSGGCNMSFNVMSFQTSEERYFPSCILFAVSFEMTHVFYIINMFFFLLLFFHSRISQPDICVGIKIILQSSPWYALRYLC
jgi:hypothetical protein